MLSSLPPELLREIIESTVPHAYHSTTYKERQATLHSLCLVSHQFRQIAQPLLFEIVWIATKSRAEFVTGLKDEETPESDTRGSTRCLVLNNDVRRFNRDDWCNFLGKFPLVRQISLYGIINVDVSVFESLPCLSELQLSVFVGLGTINPLQSVLNALRSLTLSEVTPDTMAALLNPTVLPNLAVFALTTSDELSLEALATGHFDRLLPQLEILFFDYDFWQLPKAAFLRSFANRALMDLSVEDVCALRSPEFAVVNARIRDLTWSVGGQLTQAYTKALDRLASFFEESHPSLPLRLLYLDSWLGPTSSTPPRTRQSINRLETACRERKVEIVYEKCPENYAVDFYISPDFVRRQKERRKAEWE